MWCQLWFICKSRPWAGSFALEGDSDTYRLGILKVQYEYSPDLRVNLLKDKSKPILSDLDPFAPNFNKTP